MKEPTTVVLTCSHCNKLTDLTYDGVTLILTEVTKQDTRCQNCGSMSFNWRLTKTKY